MSTDDIFDSPTQHDPVIPEEDTEFFECAFCSQWNIIRSMPNRRRVKRSRHIRADDVTWASLRKYATINNTDMNNGIKLLLYNARTNNINYLVNERKMVEPAKKKKKEKK